MKRLAAGLLCAALFLGISACSKRSDTSVPTDQLTISTEINPTTLNPILPQNASENFIDGLIFSELVTIDDHGQDVPDLASVVPTQQNGGISKDGLTITYHLRPNATWQDGTPVTSKDVKFTWQAIMNQNNNVLSHHGYDQVASVDTPDDHTVVFHMKNVFPAAVDTIFGESDTPFRILPAHLLAKYPSINQVPFNAAPIGSGPYKFVRWQRNDRIVLAANPGYYRGAPHIKQLTLKLITEDNTIESELRTGEVQVGQQILGPTYNDLANDTAIVRQLVDSPNFTAIYFNTSRAPLNDIAVRRAIALGIDRAEIVKTDTYGTGKIALGDIAPFSWAYDPSLQPIPYDPALAKTTLERDGWKLGANGIYAKNGRQLSLQLVYGQGSQLSRNVTVQVQQMLKQVGIGVQLKSYDYATLYASEQNGGILNSGKFDMTLYAWVSGADPDDSSQWLCSSIPPNGNNVSRYCSREMDQAQHVALSTFDRNVRKRAYAHIEQLLLRDVPGVFLYYQPLRYAHIPQLENFLPNGISEGWNAQDWTLQP